MVVGCINSEGKIKYNHCYFNNDIVYGLDLNNRPVGKT